MSEGKITLYNASAGSGKTYTLTGIYLTYLFQGKHNYRKILAVTFTNKATAEMKSRILQNLNLLSSGEKCDYLEELISTTGYSPEKIRRDAGEILNLILHDYSRFSVSTIDSFFQKILRAFAREAGLHSGFNIEIDHDIILSAAVDEMISSAVSDKQLRRWLTTYVMSNIDEGKSWNPRYSILKLSEEIFREKFKLLSQGEMQKLEDKDFLLEYIKKIRTVCSDFEEYLTLCGKAALKIVQDYGLTDEMFYRKSQGVPKFIRALASGGLCEPGPAVRDILSDPPRWSTGPSDSRLISAIQAGLDKVLRDVIIYYDNNIIYYRTSKVVSSNIFALGILSDVMRKVRELATAQNVFLLSDAGEFLNLITQNDQSPFIYEKAGNRFENFMIDEFQDTSRIQWNNFEPLIENSLSQGNDNLVVGDVKQSIYRWRNSDWTILESMLGSTSESFVSKPLKINWRSCPNIISFNNNLFTLLPSLLEQKFTLEDIPSNFKEMYSQAVQDDPGRKTGGYVRIEFVGNDDEKSWKEKVLGYLPGMIETLQDKGYSASDIGIIVRDGHEGSLVLKTLIDYSAVYGLTNAGRYNYSVVSNDSLLLANSPVVNFIISVLSLIDDPADMVSRAAVNRFYILSKGSGDVTAEEDEKLLPEYWEAMLPDLNRIALFEAVEKIISFFGLGQYSFNVAYLNAFQDCVMRFATGNTPDIRSFLEWWAETGSKKSLSVPGNHDAIRILTIHKSKGLEFSVVILPFISWNLDHRPGKQPLLWVRPNVAPFNELGVVPVKCVKDLTGTIFSEHYFEERQSVFLDNLNLLYVAFTRAKDVLIGYSGLKSGNNTAGSLLYEAFTTGTVFEKEPRLNSFFNKESNVFEYGEIPASMVQKKKEESEISIREYPVSMSMGSLRLKLHGENYFSAENEDVRKKINYGKLMHEVFEGIVTSTDVHEAVNNLVLEGKLPKEEAETLENKINHLISIPEVSGWFARGNNVLRETGILLPSGNIRRPDRVIISRGKPTVIDFKFGEESDHHLEQVQLYRSLLNDMGFSEVDARVWYVDKNKIVVA